MCDPQVQAYHPLTLNDILYVPYITRNLLLVSKFFKYNKVMFQFINDMCYVKY